MTEDILKDINSVANNIEQIRIAIEKTSAYHWWNTQWFSTIIGTIIGVLLAIIFGIIKDYITQRRRELNNWYLNLIKEQRPDHLFEMAYITTYGYTTTAGGKTDIITEKTLPEKVLIEFRKKYKYWNLPLSYLWFLFWRYEKILHNLPQLDRKELKNSPEYIKAQKIFEKIISLAEKETGENQWTI